jgi:hypothetical protein
MAAQTKKKTNNYKSQGVVSPIGILLYPKLDKPTKYDPVTDSFIMLEPSSPEYKTASFSTHLMFPKLDPDGKESKYMGQLRNIHLDPATGEPTATVNGKGLNFYELILKLASDLEQQAIKDHPHIHIQPHNLFKDDGDSFKLGGAGIKSSADFQKPAVLDRYAKTVDASDTSKVYNGVGARVTFCLFLSPRNGMVTENGITANKLIGNVTAKLSEVQVLGFGKPLSSTRITAVNDAELSEFSEYMEEQADNGADLLGLPSNGIGGYAPLENAPAAPSFGTLPPIGLPQ